MCGYFVMNTPLNIFLVGPMGAGKTTIGRFLADKLKLSFYDSDQVLEKQTGVPVAWIFDVEGEQGFRKREKKVIEELTKNSNIVLATGGSVVLSSSNRQALMSRGVIVYLKASINEQFERTKKDTKRPLLMVKTDLKSRLIDLQQQLENYYVELSDYVFDTDHVSPRIVANQIAKVFFSHE